jgi:NTE family protein
MASSPIERIRRNRRLAAPPIAYVLSGGAAKGFCHLGMIEALEERGVVPDLVVGTSAGSLFGSLYCHFGSVAGVYERVEEVLASRQFETFERKYFGGANEGGMGRDLHNFFEGLAGRLRTGMHLGRALVRSALVGQKDAEAIFARIFEGITFESLKIPFAAVAVDLTEGAPAVFNQEGGGGEPEALARAVRASSAIPFIFPSVEIGGHAHADGYIMANLPTREARSLLEGRDPFLAGFDVSAPLEQSEEELSHVELALRLLNLATRAKQEADRALLDVLFQPVEKSYPWSSFAQYRQFVELGRRYMTAERLAGFERAYVEKARRRAKKSLSGRIFLIPRIKRALLPEE